MSQSEISNHANPRIIITDNANPDFIKLCRELDAYLDIIAGGRVNRAQYLPYNNAEQVHSVFLIYVDGIAVGCAALKLYDTNTGEVKRVFVQNAYRGQKLGLFLMQALEKEARRLNLRALILETGAPLTEAMGLYRKLGYFVTTCYGPYKDMPDSICMRKEL